MISEIENSISLTEGIIGLKLEYAAVEWVNAYNYNEKGENGPGTTIHTSWSIYSTHIRSINF
jgi:hypothetical protein